MSNDIVTLKAGDTLVIERGCYSDFTYDGPFRVLKPLTFNKALLDELRATHKPEYEGDEFSCYGVVGAMVQLGYVEDLGCAVVHVGEYNDIDEGAFPDVPSGEGRS